MGSAWVESVQLLPGVGRREVPGDGGVLLVAGLFPGGHLLTEGIDVGDTSVQALTPEDRELDLSEPKLLHLLCCGL